MMKNRRNSRKRKIVSRSVKSLVIIACAVVLALAAVGVTVAELMDKDGPIKNIFKKAYVTSEVVETLDGNVKKDVKIKNTGNTDAYIRSFVSVTWKDSSGNVYSAVPVAGTDYKITYDLSHGWKKSSDGYYYYCYPVAPGSVTSALISSCSQIGGRAPDGYSLSVEILGSAIQSKPASLVVSQWSSGVSGVSGTTLKIK